MLSFLTKYYSCNLREDNKMDRTYSTHWFKGENLWKKVKGRSYLEVTGADVRIKIHES